jgi:hypothetical protein
MTTRQPNKAARGELLQALIVLVGLIALAIIALLPGS